MENNILKFDKYYTKKNNSFVKKVKKIHIPTSVLVFGTIILLGLLLACYARNEWSSGRDKLPLAAETSLNYVTGNYTYYDNSGAPLQMDDIWVMYNQLSDADKNVYSVFLDLVKNRNKDYYCNAVIVSNGLLGQLDNNHFWNIYYAMCFDHPEYFYLLTNSQAIECRTVEANGYTTYLYTMDPMTDYEKAQESAFNKAAQDFLKDIDMTASDSEKELAIHDKLLNLVSYDFDILQKTSATDANWDLGNTAYGALVCDSDGRPNAAVCSGYSFAFEYLLHEAGIPCGYIAGDAYKTPLDPLEETKHAWNAVRIDGKWYEVDSTWNDAENEDKISDDILTIMKKDAEKYYNIHHHYYNRTTKEMENLKASDSTLFEIEGYYPYNAVSDTAHLRAKTVSLSADISEVFLNSLVPIAE